MSESTIEFGLELVDAEGDASDGWVEVGYRIFGTHRPATRLDPEEFPEVEVETVRFVSRDSGMSREDVAKDADKVWTVNDTAEGFTFTWDLELDGNAIVPIEDIVREKIEVELSERQYVGENDL